MQDRVPQTLKGEVSISLLARPDVIIYRRKNVIVNTISYLLSRLLVNSSAPVAGVWGLALGAGGTDPAQGWSANTQPDPTALQTEMVSEIKRKQLSEVQYLDADGNPTTSITNVVNFLTIINETTDNIAVPIREMGLIGGGTTLVGEGGPTNMADIVNVKYFDPTAPDPNTVTLLNYLTLPPLILPLGVDLGIAWKLTF